MEREREGHGAPVDVGGDRRARRCDRDLSTQISAGGFMIPIEVAILRDALIAIGATKDNNEATTWANSLIAHLEAEDYAVVPEDQVAT